MEESTGNDQSAEEKVINILVIQEPQNWPKEDGNEFVCKKSSLKDVRTDDVATGDIVNRPQGLRHPHNNPVYKSQSFIISATSNATSELQGKPQMKHRVKVHDRDGETVTASMALNKDYTRRSFPQYSTDSIVNLETERRDLQLGVEYCLTNEKEQARCQKRVKLGRHKSISFPVKSELIPSFSQYHNQSTSATTCISSAGERTTSQIFASSSLTVSPVVAPSSSSSSLGSMAMTDPETPTVATTPDSGFYTPSLFEPCSSSTSAIVNPFFTSTPRRSKSAGPQTSTPCLSETPKRLKCEGIQQRFTDLCNAMDWDSLDDSGGMSEDPKDGSDSGEGESSPNSSLRSVQWLKGFSIGDSLKPLLSSPPTPGSKNQRLQSSVSDFTMASTKPFSNSTTTNLVTSIPGLPTQSFRPLPVIMAPRVPTYLQTQCGATPYTSLSSALSSSSSSSLSQSITVQGGASITTMNRDGSSNNSSNTNSSCSGSSSASGGSSCKKSGQRKALEELKMNKPERNIGRSKYTGKIFNRPGYSYMDLIKMAMQSSEEGEMTLKQIVTWIEDHFPFFKHEAKDSWKSSIRHNLSLHSDFMKADDKKHGCKWKLCNDVAQPNLHVPAPQEMTSVQTAFLKRVKKNVPQPILPKVNAYALVPIHNLTNSVADGPQQQHLVPQPPSLAPMPRKPVHILPKQMGETCVQSQEIQDVEFLDHQQYQLLPPQETPSEQYQIIQQLLQKGPLQSSIVPAVFDDQAFISASDYVSHVPAGIYQSSDSNSSQSLGFPSLRSFDQSLPMTSQFVDSNVTTESVRHVEIDDPRRALNGFSYTVEPDESAILPDHSLQVLPVSQKKDHHQNFPLNSVVEIRQEDGANPGEKKIVFILQDSENGKQLKRAEAAVKGGRKSSKNLSEIFKQESTIAIKKSPVSKSFSFCGKKKPKEGQRSHRQQKGPVLNLQSVLQQSTMEDKNASDTIGLLLQEEDESKMLTCEESLSLNGFTRVKSFSERERESHLNSHMQRALQEQTANIMSQDGIERNVPGTFSDDGNTDSSCFVEKIHCRKKILPKAGSRLLPFSANKKSGFSLRDRMGMVKHRNDVYAKSLDDTGNRNNDTNDPSPAHTLKKETSGHDNGYDLSVNRSASQLVFRRLSSSDQSTMSLPSTDSNHSYSSSNMSLSDNVSKGMTGEGDKERNISSSCRRIGNILRSKSRRKQVHVPLTIEISPVRRKSRAVTDDDQSVICVDEGRAQFISISDDSDLQTHYQTTVTTEQLPTSLCTEIQQPSLRILQEKPLEPHHHPHTSMKEKTLKVEPNEVTADYSFSDSQINSSDVDKVIENIFTCSGSPLKNEMAYKNAQPVFEGASTNTGSNTVDQLFSSEFDTPPSMLHFLSTFPKDMEFSSLPSDNDPHKASRCDDTNRLLTQHHGHHTSRISFSTAPINHHHTDNNSHCLFLSPQSHFLETPSPPCRYPPRTSAAPNSSSPSSTQKKLITCKDDSGGIKSLNLSLSPVPLSSHTNGHNNVLSWNTSMCSMDTPPCGTVLPSSSSSSSCSSSSVTASKSPFRPSTNIVVSSKWKSVRSNGINKDSKSMLISHYSTQQNEQKQQQQQHQHQDELLPLYRISNSENNSSEQQPMFSSVHHINNSHSSPMLSSLSLSSTAPSSSLPIDLTSCISYALTTPPCGNGTSSSTATSMSGNTTTNTTPLFLSVPGSASHPFILSPSPSTHHNQQHAELFPTFTPESLSILDPSIMDNLDLFINSLPGLGPGFPNVQLSPHS